MSIPPQPALLIFIPNCSTLTVPLIYSFLILSFLVTPKANLNIFISAIFISSTCSFVTATVSIPYTIAGLTIELYTFPFTLTGNLLLQITPDTFLHQVHPACTLLFTSLLQTTLSYTVDAKYLNSFTVGTFVPSIFTVSLSFSPFTPRYLIFNRLTFIPLLSNACLQHSSLRSTLSLVSFQITLLSANRIVHGGSLLTSSVSLSIISANRNGLKADPWYSSTLTLKLPVVLIAHLTTVSVSSYISCTSRTYFSTISDFLIQHILSHTRTYFLIHTRLPIATPSICLYKMLLKLNSTEVVAVFISAIKTCLGITGVGRRRRSKAKH